MLVLEQIIYHFYWKVFRVKNCGWYHVIKYLSVLGGGAVTLYRVTVSPRGNYSSHLKHQLTKVYLGWHLGIEIKFHFWLMDCVLSSANGTAAKKEVFHSYLP